MAFIIHVWQILASKWQRIRGRFTLIYNPWASSSQEQSDLSNQEATDTVTYLPLYKSIGLQPQLLQNHYAVLVVCSVWKNHVCPLLLFPYCIKKYFLKMMFSFKLFHCIPLFQGVKYYLT